MPTDELWRDAATVTRVVTVHSPRVGGLNGRTVWTVASLCVENHVDGAGIMLAKCALQT